jgi:hypothetical protein
MIGVHVADVLLMLMIGLLAIYHLVMGAIALFAPSRAARAVGVLYGAQLTDGPQLRYATSMIGALAVALGGLAAIAAFDPFQHKPVIASLIALQLARLFCRVRDRRMLAESLGVAAGRNAVMMLILGAEVAVLALAFR